MNTRVAGVFVLAFGIGVSVVCLLMASTCGTRPRPLSAFAMAHSVGGAGTPGDVVGCHYCKDYPDECRNRETSCKSSKVGAECTLCQSNPPKQECEPYTVPGAKKECVYKDLASCGNKYKGTCNGTTDRTNCTNLQPDGNCGTVSQCETRTVP